MYYVIQNGSIETAEEEIVLNNKDVIRVFTSKEWDAQVDLRNQYNLNQPHNNIHFCKLESFSNFMFGTLSIPVKRNSIKANTVIINTRRNIKNSKFKNSENENCNAPKENSNNLSKASKENTFKNKGFAFYILENSIIFIDDTGCVIDEIQKISEYKKRREYSMERFFYDFLISIIEDDLLYLELFEREISKVEEDILRGRFDHFNYKMLDIKKEIARMYRYYSQLTDVGQELAENEIDFFGKDDIATFKIFKERAARLQNESQVLRDYAIQVQEVYQSEISIKQNDVMKVLTIVTTIFLPLTLIAGWYGMNFTYMPELGWKLGYPAVAFLSVIVILVCLWIFKKKKFW